MAEAADGTKDLLHCRCLAEDFRHGFQLFFGRRFASGPIREAYLLLKPGFVMGRTIPQIEYTWSPRLIGYVKNFGGGFTLGGNWSLYFESHRWTFRDKIAITGDGPYGFHNIVVVRKTFDLTF